MTARLDELKLWASEEVGDIIESLPDELAEKARAVPVTLETAPSPGLVGDGIAPDTLGLFAGAERDYDQIEPIPPQIILFLENLWDFCDADEEVFREEVRRTYMHELGHYLGLNEDDLWDRGLD
jgi:predicted Zn-dependent protease with MMP-like domain